MPGERLGGARSTWPHPRDLPPPDAPEGLAYRRAGALGRQAAGERFPTVDAIRLRPFSARAFFILGARKTAAAWLAEAGASANETASITGHRMLGEVTRYNAAADQRSR